MRGGRRWTILTYSTFFKKEEEDCEDLAFHRDRTRPTTWRFTAAVWRNNTSFIHKKKKKNKDCEDFKPTASKPQTDTLLREIISNIIGIVTTGKLGVFRLFVDKSTASARAAQDEQEQQLRPELICWSAAQCWFTFITAEPQHSLRSAHNVHTDQVSSDLGSAVHSANAYTVHKNKYFQDY